jgi:hypothetical protein
MTQSIERGRSFEIGEASLVEVDKEKSSEREGEG